MTRAIIVTSQTEFVMCGMKSDFDWTADTPVELTKAVSHLRSVYRQAERKLSEATKYMCFRELHKDAGLQGGEERVCQHYARAFEEMVETANSSVRRRLANLPNPGPTASGFFATFTQIRS